MLATVWITSITHLRVMVQGITVEYNMKECHKKETNIRNCDIRGCNIKYPFMGHFILHPSRNSAFRVSLK